MIYRFQPFSTDKKLFGQVYNNHCELVKDSNAWIQLTDYDTLPLTPESYLVIEKAIQRYPDTAIFGAMTNRLGLREQRLNQDEPDPNSNIEWHITKAKELAEDYQDGECKDARTIAGFFLLFRKSFWEQNKFQDQIRNERGSFFDNTFSRYARKNNMPMRIIKGLYVWHTYRLGNKDWKNFEHLL